MSELDEIKEELAALKRQLASSAPGADKFPEELKDKYRKLLAEKPASAQE